MTIDKTSVDIFADGMSSFFTIIQNPFSNMTILLVICFVAIMFILGLIFLVVAMIKSQGAHN